jgi:hypothetical protein
VAVTFDAAGRHLGVIPLPAGSKTPGTLLAQDRIAHAAHHHHFNHSHQFDPAQGGGWAEMGDARGGGDHHVLRTGYGGSKFTGGPREGDMTDDTVAPLPSGIAGSEVRPISTILNCFIRSTENLTAKPEPATPAAGFFVCGETDTLL